MDSLRVKIYAVDDVDRKLLRALAADARRSIADLAREVGLSAPSTAERLRRLEGAGILRGYTARIDPGPLGRPLAAYIRVRPMPGQLKKVVQLLEAIPEIVECDRVTGEDCFIAKARLHSIEELEAVIDKIIPFAMTNSSIIQSTPIAPRLPPLPLSED